MICNTRRIQLIDSNFLIIISICFIGFDQAIIRFSGFPLLLACQAPPKTAMHDASLRRKHRASQPKPSLGAPKMEPRALWNGKNAFAAVLKKIMRCRGVSKHLRFPPPKSQILSVKHWIAGCHFEAKHEVAVVSLTCFAAFPDCQFCSHWFAACAEPPGVYGSRACEGGPKPADNCCLPVLVFHGSNHTL